MAERIKIRIVRCRQAAAAPKKAAADASPPVVRVPACFIFQHFMPAYRAVSAQVLSQDNLCATLLQLASCFLRMHAAM